MNVKVGTNAKLYPLKYYTSCSLGENQDNHETNLQSMSWLRFKL